MQPALSVVIVNYNTWSDCRGAVASLLRSPPHAADGAPLPWEIVVLDNASPRQDAGDVLALEQLLASHGGRLLRADKNLGYAGGCNAGCASARGPWILVANPDVVFQPGCVDALLRAAERDPAVAAAAPLGFLDEDLTLFLPVDFLPTPSDSLALALATCHGALAERRFRRRVRRALHAWRRDADRELGMLSGHVLLLRRALAGDRPFDERYPLFYEDADLCQRLRRAGHRLLQVHDALVVHRHDRSGRTDPEAKAQRLALSRPRYFRRWYGGAGAAVDAVARRRISGRAAERATRRLAATSPAAPQRAGMPWLPLERPCARFLALLAADPWMSLPGGVFGGGDAWLPSAAVRSALDGREAFVRIVDLDAPDLPEVARYRLGGGGDG